MKIILTGGHHSSAMPVMDELIKLDQNASFYWIGHKHSLKGDKNDTLEYVEITNRGIPFYDLQLGKFYGYSKFTSIYKLVRGYFKSVVLLINIKPDVVLSFGGYIAVPVAFAAYTLRIPIVTHEQTVVSGYANKLIAHFANKIFISFPSSQSYFPLDKTVVTGLPIRQSIFSAQSNSFDINTDLPTIYVTGGKTGSHKLNMAIISLLPEILKVANIIHQTGDYSEYNDFATANDAYNKIINEVPGKYFTRKFIFDDEIGEAFTKSNVVISRGGAHSVQELYLLNKNAIIVPIPWVSHNEQFLNAQFLQSKTGALIYNESDLEDLDKFFAIIKETIHKPVNNVPKLDHAYASKKIAEETVKISKKS